MGYHGKNPLLVTASKTLDIADLNQLIYVSATGAVTITLPNPDNLSSYFWVDIFNATNTDLTVMMPTALLDTLVGVNDREYDSVAVTTANQKIGALLQFFYYRGRWHCAGVSNGITYTFAG